MKSFDPAHIKPGIFDPDAIESIFTLADRKNPQLSGEIGGFNLGLNTSESSDIIDRNRAILSRMLNSSAERLVYAVQIHSTNIQYVKEGGLIQDTDAFYTDVKELPLCIQVADCAVVLLADETNAVIGAAHAGWRGAIGGVVPSLISKMSSTGAKPAVMKAFISPCISLESFEVGEEVAAVFPERYVDYSSFEKPHIDLKRFIKDQLINCGIKENNIEVNKDCTLAGSDYYSYRREGIKSGRMMGAIKLIGK